MADEEKETKRISRILSGFKSIGSRAASYPKDAARNVYYDYRAQSIMTDEQKKLSKQREEAYKAEEAAYKEKARREKEEEEAERRERDRRKQGGMGSGMMGGVAVQQAKSEDKGTWWLIFAIGIALLDIFWGDPYRGFKFTMLGILQTNFVAIFSSIIFLVLLLANVFFSIFKNRHRSIFTFIALYFAVNYIARFKIYSFEINTIYINIFIFMMVAIYLWRVFRREEPFNVISDEDKGYILFIFVVSYFWFQNGWQLEIKSWIHFVFIIIFGMLFIKTHEPSPERWYYLTSFFLVLDFYGYSLSKDIEGLSLIFNLFPPILIFISLYVYVRTQNRLTIPIILFMTIVLFLANPTVLGDDSGQVLQKEKGKTAGEIYKEFKNSVLEVFDTRLVEASGGYYRGKVEKNQYEKLGVYLDNIRASEPRYYTDEPITIWGSLKSKTYGDVVIANFNCYRWTSGREKIKASRLEPAEPFPIFTLEEKDLECTFNPGIVTDEQQQKEQRFSAGTHTVTLAANYNFATDAYQKSYFIDRDRYRAMIRDELDPFEQYGITDKAPIAVYTNGPVAIGMQMTPLIPVEITNAARPLLGFTLTNRGKIFDSCLRESQSSSLPLTAATRFSKSMGSRTAWVPAQPIYKTRAAACAIACTSPSRGSLMM
ncbi:hypothetical protein HYX09_01545 [Candidatus Woesearchaeota archaeon]|nr:hypothetical protein [Candidatus Woesearchaeota archaeon]